MKSILRFKIGRSLCKALIAVVAIFALSVFAGVDLFAQRKPVIGVSGYTEGSTARVGMTYVNSVRAAGGVVFVIPVTTDAAIIDEILDNIDGLVMTGGEDVSPLIFGEQPHLRLGEVVPERDTFDLTLIKRAIERGIPVLGICRGEQSMNIAMGGSLYQDIPTQVKDAVQHRQVAPNYYGSHTIKIVKGSLLNRLLGVEEINVNSFHHQAVKDLAPGFKITARATDGVVEAIESENGKAFGVQFHPEGFVNHGDMRFLPIFEHLVKMASEYRATK